MGEIGCQVCTESFASVKQLIREIDNVQASLQHTLQLLLTWKGIRCPESASSLNGNRKLYMSTSRRWRAASLLKSIARCDQGYLRVVVRKTVQ